MNNMAKCAKCGKRIEYNSFTVIDGVVYHPNCAPKKEIAKVEKEEAEEQFERTMEGYETSSALEEVKPKRKRSRKKNETDTA